MAGRSARSRRASQDTSLLLAMRTPERARRSLSQGDDTPRPPGVLQSASGAPTNAAGNAAATTASQSGQAHPGDANAPAHAGADVLSHTPNKRLGFLGEKLLPSSVSNSSASTLRGTPVSQLLPRSHSRAESTNLLSLSRETSASPAPTMASSPGQLAKGHTSPSKLVTREMHRLGNLAHLPVLNPSISTTSNLTLASTAALANPSSTIPADSPWPALHLSILPLFNGEPLRIPIEDLNLLVKRHIQSVISSTPSKALVILEKDATELIANGMVTLNAKLSGIEDERKLVHRVVEVWGFFWDQVLPYVEGALLPLQTDPMLSALYRMPKTKPSSPGTDGNGGKSGTTPYSYTKSQQIDVRTIALQLFRDQIIYPIFPTLHDWLNEVKDDEMKDNEMKEQQVGGSHLGYQLPRLQQMLLVLVSQRVPPPNAHPTPPPSPGEEAIQALLRVIRTPLVHSASNARSRRSHFGGTGAPSFLSAGLPRDRRGRIAQKPGAALVRGVPSDFLDAVDDGGETPRLPANFGGGEVREREKGWEVLESLRSPDQETTRTSMGGWGLGAGAEEKKSEEDDDEDESMSWDQAQAAVERMVGITNSEPGQPPPAPPPLADMTLSRRRAT